MAQYAFGDAMVLFRSPPDPDPDIDAAITAATNYTDADGELISVSIDTSRTTASITPHGTNHRARVLPGTVSGSISLVLARDNVTAGGAAEMLEAIDDGDGRLIIGIQPERSDLVSGGTLTPAASVGNPQWIGHAVITGVSHWGGGGVDEPALANFTMVIDRDFARYTS